MRMSLLRLPYAKATNKGMQLWTATSRAPWRM